MRNVGPGVVFDGKKRGVHPRCLTPDVRVADRRDRAPPRIAHQQRDVAAGHGVAQPAEPVTDARLGQPPPLHPTVTDEPGSSLDTHGVWSDTVPERGGRPCSVRVPCGVAAGPFRPTEPRRQAGNHAVDGQDSEPNRTLGVVRPGSSGAAVRRARRWRFPQARKSRKRRQTVGHGPQGDSHRSSPRHARCAPHQLFEKSSVLCHATER